jgi:hypothetical protein
MLPIAPMVPIAPSWPIAPVAPAAPDAPTGPVGPTGPAGPIFPDELHPASKTNTRVARIKRAYVWRRPTLRVIVRTIGDWAVPRRLPVKRWLVLVCLAGACNRVASSAPGALAIHDLHEPSTPVLTPSNQDDFYRLPFPNDLRIDPDGTVALTRYPRGGDPGTLTAKYVEVFDSDLRGFGPNAGMFFRFDAAIDDKTLPADANAAMQPGASLFVVDVTKGSPTYGMRAPVISHYVAQSYDFIGPFWIAILPYPGIPLNEKTTYAAVLTDGLKAADGGAVHRDKDLDAALAKGAASSSDPKIAAAAKAYAPLSDWLATQPGFDKHVVNATVFTTMDATSIMFTMRKAVYDFPAPQLVDLAYTGEDVTGVDQIYTGHYNTPNYQQGDVPFTKGGGQIEFDDTGAPKVARTETLRVAMTLPEGTMPAVGWPVIIYAHGTGGDWKDFIFDHTASRGANVTDASGKSIAKLAAISIDQVLAGPRDPTGSDPDLTFFNFQNPVGARFNPIQGGLDDFQLLRLVKSISVTAAPMTGVPIKFDPDRIYFKGHSQGSTTGSLFVAAEPELKAAVFSGPGAGLIYALLNKTKPVNIPNLLGGLLHDPVDQWHPLFSLLQSYLELADSANYARFYFKEPPTGFAPKSIFQGVGITDNYAPVPNNFAQAIATGLQPYGTMLKPIDGLDLAHLTWTSGALTGNVANGAAVGVLVEYDASKLPDGHFVIGGCNCSPAANYVQYDRMLANLAATGMARIDPP